MRQQSDITQLNAALTANFRLKAKILSIMFGVVLFLQLCGMTIVILKTDLAGKVIPIKMMVFGPSLLALIFVCEIAAFRYLKKIEGREGGIKQSFIYLSTFVEVTFPCAIMFLVGNFLRGTDLFPPMQIINSPLLVILFIMILLSTLLLDPRLSIFAGFVGAIEYLAVNLAFIGQEAVVGPVEIPNVIIKCLFIAVSGLICGFISKKIQEAVVSSLHSKNELIHHLDKRVAEKTAELEKKNLLLEEKQKEILDSIHYAKRIQYTLLPNEKYIARMLEKLKNN